MPGGRPRTIGKRVTTVCPHCGKEFWYYVSWPRKYCSNVCAGSANVANIRHFAPTGYDKSCEQCGKTYHVKPKGTRGRFCSSRCWGDWQSANIRGEAHPNFRGGYPPYYGPSWRSARKAARERDKICQRCGKTPEEAGKSLDVHHIVVFRLFGLKRHAEANALSNLITVCNSCHHFMEPD